MKRRADGMPSKTEEPFVHQVAIIRDSLFVFLKNDEPSVPARELFAALRALYPGGAGVKVG